MEGGKDGKQSMNNRFDTCVNRDNLGNMKENLRTKAMRDRDLQGFSGAEMDFPTAPCIARAVHALADRGIYGFTVQTREYNDAIVWWMKHTRNWEIDPAWIVPTYGTIFSVATAIRMCLKDEQDAMLVITPVYYRYEQAATRMHKRTLHCPMNYADGRFSIDLSRLEEMMALPEVKLLILCNPNNPTGNIWTEDTMRQIARMSVRYDVVVFSDEIFANDVYGGRSVVSYGSIEAGRSRAIVSTSLGKSFNFTGVNHADMLIPDPQLRERFATQRTADHFGSIGPFEYVCVKAAYSPEGREWKRQANAYVEENMKLVQAFFAERLAPNHVCVTEGAFIAFIEWRGLKLRGEEITDFFEKEALVQLEPGIEYAPEYDRFTRMSVGSTRDQIRSALERMEAAIAAHPEVCIG